MPRPKPTADDLKARKVRAKQWRKFRAEFKFSQKKLAEALGLSRRTIQMVERGDRKPEGGVTPHRASLTKFDILANRYANGLGD